MIGKKLTRPCERYLVKDKSVSDFEITTKIEVFRKSVEFVIYRISQTDEQESLLTDTDFSRERLRRITTFEQDGKTYETIENDYPLHRFLWNSLQNLRKY